MKTENPHRSFLQIEDARGPESLDRWPAIVLWGAGSYVENVIRWFGTDRVSAIYDKDPYKYGKKICGLAVQPPERFSVGPDTAVVISASNHIHEIAASLVKTYGVSKRQIYPIITNWQVQHRYLPDFICTYRAEAERVMDLLEDSASKQYFAGYMNAVLTMNPTCLVCNPNIITSYIYQGEQERIVPRKGDCIVDCGAYTGDTMDLLISLAENNCSFFGIEPVPGNYQALCKTAEKYSSIHPVVWQYALGEKIGQTAITAESEITPRATIHGEYAKELHAVTSMIAVETLDHLFSCQKVDYIKMDIEGEEVRALKGAETIIVRDRPTMMLSAYHLIEHLWEIPLLLHSFVPSYRIYCGHQPNAPLEPEFYCIAK